MWVNDGRDCQMSKLRMVQTYSVSSERRRQMLHWLDGHILFLPTKIRHNLFIVVALVRVLLLLVRSMHERFILLISLLQIAKTRGFAVQARQSVFASLSNRVFPPDKSRLLIRSRGMMADCAVALTRCRKERWCV